MFSDYRSRAPNMWRDGSPYRAVRDAPGVAAAGPPGVRAVRHSRAVGPVRLRVDGSDQWFV